jgi:hypothetical protein
VTAPLIGQIGDSGAVAFDEGFDDGPLSDEELTALALAADPDQPVNADAVPWDLYPQPSVGALPRCYLPLVMAGASKGWRTPVVMAIIAALVVVDLFGLCITFGQLVAA